VFCPDCGQPVAMRDEIEEKFESPTAKDAGVRDCRPKGWRRLTTGAANFAGLCLAGFQPNRVGGLMPFNELREALQLLEGGFDWMNCAASIAGPNEVAAILFLPIAQAVGHNLVEIQGSASP